MYVDMQSKVFAVCVFPSFRSLELLQELLNLRHMAEVNSSKLAFDILLMAVKPLVVATKHSVVVEEYRPSEVAKRVVLVKLVAEQPTLEYPVQAV